MSQTQPPLTNRLQRPIGRWAGCPGTPPPADRLQRSFGFSMSWSVRHTKCQIPVWQDIALQLPLHCFWFILADDAAWSCSWRCYSETKKMCVGHLREIHVVRRCLEQFQAESSEHCCIGRAHVAHEWSPLSQKKSHEKPFVFLKQQLINQGRWSVCHWWNSSQTRWSDVVLSQRQGQELVWSQTHGTRVQLSWFCLPRRQNKVNLTVPSNENTSKSNRLTKFVVILNFLPLKPYLSFGKRLSIVWSLPDSKEPVGLNRRPSDIQKALKTVMSAGECSSSWKRKTLGFYLSKVSKVFLNFPSFMLECAFSLNNTIKSHLISIVEGKNTQKCQMKIQQKFNTSEK